MGLDVDRSLEDFSRALDRYLHLLRGGKIDRRAAMLVERLELELMSELDSLDWRRVPGTAREALDELARIGWLYEAVERIARAIGDEAADPASAVAAFLRGDMEKPGSRAALIVVQAVSRFVAEKRLSAEGPVEAVTPRCPVCGAESRTMVVERDGYYMICPFCTYKWRVSRTGRMVCPFCGSADPIAIGVFTDRKRRLGLFVCQECGATWRGILDRSIRAPRILLPVISLGAEAFRGFVEEHIKSLSDHTGDAGLEDSRVGSEGGEDE